MECTNPKRSVFSRQRLPGLIQKFRAYINNAVGGNPVETEGGDYQSGFQSSSWTHVHNIAFVVSMQRSNPWHDFAKHIEFPAAQIVSGIFSDGAPRTATAVEVQPLVWKLDFVHFGLPAVSATKTLQ